MIALYVVLTLLGLLWLPVPLFAVYRLLRHADNPLPLVLAPTLGLLWFLLGLSAFIVAYPASYLIKWDKTESTGGGGEAFSNTIRGDLPWWLNWYQTPDERFPGGMNEPTVVGWMFDYGKRVCSARWMMRNRMMGLGKAIGYETSDYIPEGAGYWERIDGTWRWAVHIGSFEYKIGHQVYKYLDGKFWAVPVLTLKRR